MNWLQLIERRKSVRQFALAVEEVTIARVREICSRVSAESKRPLELRLVPGLEIHPMIKGFLGSYGRVLSPWYLAVISQGDKNSMVDMGYYTQKAILEMTSLNLGTCWIGGLYDKQALGDNLNVGESKGVRALIAWGKPGRETWNKAIKFTGGLGKRVPPEKISVLDSHLDPLKYPWRAVLEAVRWAPSAANRQPWRLWFSARAVHVFSAPGKLNRSYIPIDIGIALCHLELACQQLGIPGKITKTSHPQPKGWEYWATYVID